MIALFVARRWIITKPVFAPSVAELFIGGHAGDGDLRGILVLTASQMPDSEQYCPICQRVIIASNAAEVESGEHDGYVFVHDDITHEDSDIDALTAGIN